MGTSEREELTVSERYALDDIAPMLGGKAVRIIDAHAADRAALVAQLVVANRDKTGLSEALSATQAHQRRLASERDAAESEVERLTRERDEARAEVRHRERKTAELVEALAAAEHRAEQLDADRRMWLESSRAADCEAAKCIRELSDLRDDTESRLAAANALLEAATTFIPEALWAGWERTKAAHLRQARPPRTALPPDREGTGRAVRD